MGGQAGEVRAIGARGRTSRAGPRSSTRGVYTHDAAAAATRREMYFSTIAVFFLLLLAGTNYSTTTCGYHSTTARFSFHPASAHDHVRSRVGLIPKEQPSPSVGYYSTPHFCGYHFSTTYSDIFLFSTCAHVRAAIISSDFPREEDSLRFCLFRENCVVVERNRGRAGHERSAEGADRRECVTERSHADARGRLSRVPGSVHRETRGTEERKLG